MLLFFFSSPNSTPRNTLTPSRFLAAVELKTPPSTLLPFPALSTWPKRPSFRPPTSWSSSSRLTLPSKNEASGHRGEQRPSRAEVTSSPPHPLRSSPAPTTPRSTPAVWNASIRSWLAKARSLLWKLKIWIWSRTRTLFSFATEPLPTPRFWPPLPERPSRTLSSSPPLETSFTSIPRLIRLIPDVATGSNITKVNNT